MTPQQGINRISEYLKKPQSKALRVLLAQLKAGEVVPPPDSTHPAALGYRLLLAAGMARCQGGRVVLLANGHHMLDFLSQAQNQPDSPYYQPPQSAA